MNAQRFLVAGLFRCGAFRATVGRLRDQQVVDVGGAIVVDHEPHIRLEQVDLVNRQAVAVLIVQAFDHYLLPLEEIAGFQGVEGVQLIDLRAPGDA
ncbi:hypothetical protein D3C76_108720 [compost metagenome]